MESEFERMNNYSRADSLKIIRPQLTMEDIHVYPQNWWAERKFDLRPQNSELRFTDLHFDHKRLFVNNRSGRRLQVTNFEHKILDTCELWSSYLNSTDIFRRCSFNEYGNRYQFLRYSSDPKKTLLKDLTSMMREQKVNFFHLFHLSLFLSLSLSLSLSLFLSLFFLSSFTTTFSSFRFPKPLLITSKRSSPSEGRLTVR